MLEQGLTGKLRYACFMSGYRSHLDYLDYHTQTEGDLGSSRTRTLVQTVKSLDFLIFLFKMLPLLIRVLFIVI